MGGARCKWRGEEEEKKKRGMREDEKEMFYPRWLSICPESGIKCCLDWRVDKNSSLSEHRLLYQVEEKCGRRIAQRRGGRGRMNGVRREGRVDEKEKKRERHRKGGK